MNQEYAVCSLGNMLRAQHIRVSTTKLGNQGLAVQLSDVQEPVYRANGPVDRSSLVCFNYGDANSSFHAQFRKAHSSGQIGCGLWPISVNDDLEYCWEEVLNVIFRKVFNCGKNFSEK